MIDARNQLNDDKVLYKNTFNWLGKAGHLKISKLILVSIVTFQEQFEKGGKNKVKFT
jgi:hypothetical protein